MLWNRQRHNHSKTQWSGASREASEGAEHCILREWQPGRASVWWYGVHTQLWGLKPRVKTLTYQECEKLLTDHAEMGNVKVTQGQGNETITGMWVTGGRQ